MNPIDSMDKKNVVHSKTIEVKQRLSNVYIIKSGLSADDKILIDGLQTVKEDEKIKPKMVSATSIFNSLELIKQ